MSEQNMQDALKRTVRHVVETMCFSEVAPSEHALENVDTIVTAVNFYGSRSGRLQLEVSSSAAWSLRDAFLGGREQDAAADGSAGELVSELGTMICGRFLSSVDPLAKMSLDTKAGLETKVSLNTPQRANAGNRAPEDLRQRFVLDSGHLTASVEFDKE